VVIYNNRQDFFMPGPLPGPRSSLVGLRFGRLTVQRYSHKLKQNKGWRHFWRCLCDCGELKTTDTNSLRQGLTVSCGCYNRERPRTWQKHGYCKNDRKDPKHQLYRVWSQMLQRCNNPNDQRYEYYGGRGITVCPRWQGAQGFVNFLRDLGPRPKGTSLERKDNAGNYCPKNCKWATKQEQARNSKNAKQIEYRGKTQSVSEWAEELGFSGTVLLNRLRLGWSVARAFTQPTRAR
jgi:hypothetical protein